MANLYSGVFSMIVSIHSEWGFISRNLCGWNKSAEGGYLMAWI
ncbi:MAG: hypothetical protein S4CHLAM102_10890 [Chlamydiia bacterium]|nr:hypothetical protein [Chlamydiia bacterium]